MLQNSEGRDKLGPEFGILHHVPPPTKPRLLVADDEVDLLSLMKDALETEGYEVREAADGEEALEKIRADPPDIVVLDVWMPRKDGFAVCREIKADPALQHLPVVLLSAAGGRDNRVTGLDIGADDFIAKPVDLIELLARIRMILRRTRQGLDANPLTRLPGNVSIENRISEAVASGRPFAVLYVDLNGFKAYNDIYGFDSGDRVIKATGQLLLMTSRQPGEPVDFVGHIGGDDFIVVTDPERMETLAQRIVAGFDAMAPSFYSDEDRKRGKILAQDRRGLPQEYPLLSVAIGVCHNKLRPIGSYAQVSHIGAELKKFAKGNPGSSYVVDRRRE